MSTRVRFAPSPTGHLHLGGARTALFNYLFARQKNGKFILRIDDTDQERSELEFEQSILDSFAWLKLDYDEFYRQSERTELYKSKLEALIKADKAYLDGEAVRLRSAGERVGFTDLIKGEVSFDTKELGDFIIARNLESPVYHFASVVDDMDLKISHVIRAEEHLANTPRQILILEALGGERPQYAHIPLILAPDRSKLSKRHGATAVADYAKLGYLPEAMINYLATLGWSLQVKNLPEILSLEELVKNFDLAEVQKSGAIFNTDKLDWYNKEYIKNLPEAEQVARLKSEHEFFTNRPENISPELLKTTEHLPTVIKLLEQIPETDFTTEKIKAAIWDYATEKGRGEVLWPMRVALTGLAKSPDPFTVASVLGKKESLERLKGVI